MQSTAETEPVVASGVALPPAGAAFDYQLGGAYDHGTRGAVTFRTFACSLAGILRV